jgi:beta-mannosidase
MAAESRDLLAGAAWECTATAPGAAARPEDLDALGETWWPATVPGTAAGALRAAGAWHRDDGRDFDAQDWWYRCKLGDVAPPAPGAVLVLRAEGLATIGEVWVGGERVLASASMFEAGECRLPASMLGLGQQIALAFRALRPLLDERRPRPRWRTQLVADQGLRFYRTTMLGRARGWADGPAPVGPWRPVTLRPAPPLDLVERDLAVSCEEGSGVVRLNGRLRVSPDAARGTSGRLRLGDTAAPISTQAAGSEVTVSGEVRLPDVERWWPHTHGAQPLYPLSLELGDQVIGLGRVGFRTLEVDRSKGGFRIVVNGVPVFCRGACWVPPDPVGLVPDAGSVRRRLASARAAGMNVVRLTGTMLYEDDAFFDCCDELGLLVWQDVMLAGIDPPDDDELAAAVEREVGAVLRGLQGRPSPAVVCGGSEIEQQAAMLGRHPDRRSVPLIEQRLPVLAGRLLPGVPYVTSSPTGGEPPFRPDTGISHYFGVGAYLRPLEDARRASVRFAAECLALSVPPESAVVERVFGGATAAGHDPAWKRGVPRNAACSWDFEDVRDHYVQLLFGVEAGAVRRADPERALDLGRAACAHLVESTLAEWRRPGSGCWGAIVLAMADLEAGAGWGLLDADGTPKASWHAFRRAASPLAVLLTDEGLNGVAVHCCNDRAEAFRGVLVVELFDAAGRSVANADRPVEVPSRGGATFDAEELLGAFWDVAYAYRFGPPAHDAVVATLRDGSGGLRGRGVHLPLGLARPVEVDLGLEAAVVEDDGNGFVVEVSTRRLAQFTTVTAPGYVASDSWFHLPPGSPYRVGLLPVVPGAGPPAGRISALNSRKSATFRLEP